EGVRGNCKELAPQPRHLARVLDALLAGTDVGAAAGRHDRLGVAAAHVLGRHEHRSALHLVRGEHRRGPRRRRGIDERQILLAARLDAGHDAAGENAGHRRDAALEPLVLAGSRRHGYTGGASRPVRSLQPIMTLRFCTPLAEPPLPRLSIADTHTARPVRWSETTVTSQ